MYGQRKKATDLIRSTAILQRVIYLSKCLGMRPFVNYLEKLESTLLPNSCVSSAANLLSHALESTPVTMTPAEFKVGVFPLSYGWFINLFFRTRDSELVRNILQ